MDKREEQIEDIESTGPGIGVASTGVPVGGGSMGGTVQGSPVASGTAGSRDTDTGFRFGIGQSTSTGSLPTQGGSNLDGTDPEGTLQVDSRYGATPPTGHISSYGDVRSEADQTERASDD